MEKGETISNKENLHDLKPFGDGISASTFPAFFQRREVCEITAEIVS